MENGIGYYELTKSNALKWQIWISCRITKLNGQLFEHIHNTKLYKNQNQTVNRLNFNPKKKFFCHSISTYANGLLVTSDDPANWKGALGDLACKINKNHLIFARFVWIISVYFAVYFSVSIEVCRVTIRRGVSGMPFGMVGLQYRYVCGISLSASRFFNQWEMFNRLWAIQKLRTQYSGMRSAKGVSLMHFWNFLHYLDFGVRGGREVCNSELLAWAISEWPLNTVKWYKKRRSRLDFVHKEA